MIYYVYMYLREDGSPYYVGQGKDDRWRKKHNCVVPPKERVLFVEKNTTKEWACFLEMQLIDEYGRLNDGTGTLENLSDGGQKGNVGLVHTEETKKVLSQKLSRPRTLESRKKQSKTMTGQGNHYYGRKHSDEIRQKMRKKRTNLDGYTPEVLAHRSKLNSNTMKERWRKYKSGIGPHPVKGTYLNTNN